MLGDSSSSHFHPNGAIMESILGELVRFAMEPQESMGQLNGTSTGIPQ